MFSRQKPQVDIKKSTLKILDRKKDTPTKLRHLRLVLDSVDATESKILFCTHYEPIYKIIYEGIITAEANLKQRGGLFLSAFWSQSLAETLPFSLGSYFPLVHRAQREELESVLYLLEKVLLLCPDNLNGRWQLHSLSRLLAKLNHPGNSIRLRREGMRLFIIWYQCLGKNAPDYIHRIFASLVPGVGLPLAWPPAVEEPTLGVTPLEITPLIPALTGEKQPEDITTYFLECLLEFIVTQAPRIHWNNGAEMWAKSIDFLYERIKEFYLPSIFQNFQIFTNIYKPVLELPEPRKGADIPCHVMFACQVVFVKWIANYAHSVYRATGYYQLLSNNQPITSHHHDDRKSNHSPHSSLSGDRDSMVSYSSLPSDVDYNILAKDVFLGTRENINLLHEIFRRALLLPFVHSTAIRRVICIYRDWIQINVPELPVFMLEAEGEDIDDAGSEYSKETPKSRLRTDSYYGAISFNANNNREEYLSHNLRAGAQKVLRVFYCNSASVFLLFQTPKDEPGLLLLEEQVDVCKRVLNIYRYAVMNTRMDASTWEQLLVVILHITWSVLDVNQRGNGVKSQDSLGQKLASALFQTLIVSWVKASLNVFIPIDLWDQLQKILSELTIFDALVTEWAKTMETLTRVLARHVYNLDLTNLPLDRLTEQKAKRKRGVESEGRKIPKTPEDGGHNLKRQRHISQGTSSERKPIFSPNEAPNKKFLLRRSFSDGNLTTPLRDGRSGEGDLNLRPRKMSRSMDSLRRIFSKEGPALSTILNQPDWAEISSSTTSLENTSNVNPEVDSLERKSKVKDELIGVIAGGKTKGWLPSVASILWRRMLGVLGNVNNFANPTIHAHFFQIITDTWNTLLKIRTNQGVSLDNMSTPYPPKFVPPLLMPASWCFQALELPNVYQRGKILACGLLCDITLFNQDIDFHQEYICKFYSTIHKCIITNNQCIVNEIVKRCGIRYVSKMLPGFSLLLLDLVHASHSVLSSDDLRNTPRVEAATLLGTMLGISDILKDLKVLRADASMFQQTQTNYSKLVLSYLLQTAKVEQTSHARVIALQSLTLYLTKHLYNIMHYGFSTIRQGECYQQMNEIFGVLLASLKIANSNLILVTSDLLLLLSEYATEIISHFPEFCADLIMVLKWNLERALLHRISGFGRSTGAETRVFTSLLLTLGEWCMKLPAEILLDVASRREPLLSAVFDVLKMLLNGIPNPNRKVLMPSNLEGFDPTIPFDDLQAAENRTRANSLGQSESSDLADQSSFNTIKRAARNLMAHLMTQYGHFPISNGASRCCSIVSENDDIGVEDSELDIRIFSLPNVQMFAIDNETLMTMIELSNNESEEAHSLTSSCRVLGSQVRIILRDISGKACWDATDLMSISDQVEFSENVLSLPVPNLNHPEGPHFHSTGTSSFFPQLGPRLTVRHRLVGHLPTVEDSADDLDNLDDLLEYIGHTSPECVLISGESLTSPCHPPPSVVQEQEDDVIACIVSQRSLEMEHLVKVDSDVTMRAKSLPFDFDINHDSNLNDMTEENLMSLGASTKSGSLYSSSFMLSRKLFSQLGLNGWEKRSNIYLLNKNERLLRELKHLDNQKCRESHKIAVIYVAHGQEDKQSILYNTAGSEAYEDFVSGLGWEVELETHQGFMGGLYRNKSSGETAPYFATSFTEVIFHVATRLPSNTEESLLQKTRHLGNDEVHIVWSEHVRDYRRDIIPTEFCDVLIVVYPLQYGLYRVQIAKNSEIPYFGPLYNEAVVNGDVLPSLVRATAINASRARRSILPYFQYHFQERSKTLSSIIQNHKVRTTFEQFAANVFSPILPVIAFQTGSSVRASTSSVSSTARGQTESFNSSSYSGSTLLDQHSITAGILPSVGPIVAPPRRMTAGPNFLSSSFSPYENVVISPSSGKLTHIHQPASSDISSASPVPVSPVPPVPPKRHALKLVSSIKPKLQTPPASPATSLRSTPGYVK